MGPLNVLPIAKALFLIAAANGAPVIGKMLLRDRMAFPIDGELKFSDGRPLFGKSKTIRGIVLSLFVTGMLAQFVGLGFLTGAMISAAAMIGDLFSSFSKRRLKIPPSSMAIALDQVPEALLPALVARYVLPLTLWDVTAITFVFFVAGLLFSPFFFALKIRDKPY